MMGAFMALIVMICGVTLVESAKVATFHAEQTVTYNAPTNIPVTLYANGGSFSGNNEYNTTLTFDGILNGSSLVPTAPTRTGYTLSGWKYSTDGTSWSASVISSSTVFPFTDHLYLQAQWSVNTYTLSYNLNSGTHGSSHPDGASYNTSFTVSHPTRSGYDFIGWNITGMDSVTHRYGGSTTTNTSISGTTATTFNNLRSTSGTVTFTATWAQRLTIPSQNGTLTYSGSAQTPSWNNYDNNKMTCSVSSQTNAGNHSATFSLIDKTNYHWSDGSTTNKTVPWSIGQLAGSIPYGVTALNKNVGDSAFTNPLTNTGDGTVSYSISCSPSGVATINSSSGLVTLGSVTGTATVTATVTNSSNTTYATKTASYTITLSDVQNTDLSFFNITNRQITGVAAGKTLPSEVILPDDGSVTGIMNNAFENNTTMTSITIPSSVVGIGNKAFYNSALTSITFEDTDDWWESEVGFSGCFANSIDSALSSMTPSQIASVFVGNKDFDGVSCSWITFTVDGSGELIGLGSTSDGPMPKLVVEGSTITEFADWVHLLEFNQSSIIRIPYGFTDIAGSAFKNVTDLTSVVLPASMQGIGNEAFSGCTSLSSITIPSSVTSIGSNAFAGCSSLTSVTFENSNGWWAGTTQLSSANLSNTSTAATYLKTTYYNQTFTRYTPESYFYWDGTTLVGFSSAGYNSGVKNIVIPPKATAIGDYAFYYSYWTGTNSHTGSSSGVTSVAFAGNSVTSIGSSAFAYCTSLASITIPSGVTSIRNNAFYNCTGLTSITIPGSITSIEERAFWQCNNITTIKVPTSITSIGMAAFCISGDNHEMLYGGTWAELEPLLLSNNSWYNSMDWESVNSATAFTVVGSNPLTEWNKMGEITITTTDGSRVLYTGSIPCFTSNTEIWCWDEKKKRIYKKKIKDVTYDDILLVWNFDEGKLDYANPLWIKRSDKMGSLHRLKFSDGSILEVLGNAHYIYSVTKQRFVNACDERDLRLGDEVFTAEGKSISLVSREEIKELFDSYSILSNRHINIFTNGILTSTNHNNLYEIRDMKFVKDDRPLRDISEYEGVDEEFFNGLRLSEQTDEAGDIANFVNKLMLNQKGR